MYNNGDGILQNPNKAIYWYRKSAEQGYKKAQYSLGERYYHGYGVEQDRKSAAYWMKKSYENGNEMAKEFWDENELWKYE